MIITIKTKLRLGLGFLFGVIILLGSLGAYYTYAIANESKKILKDNYVSVEYAKTMLQALDNLGKDTLIALKSVERNLQLQKANITEVGEMEMTHALELELQNIKNNEVTSHGLLSMKSTLYKIMDLNMQAILRKNADAQKTADKVFTYIAVIGGICFIIVFTFIINFPGYIANPIKQLTESIKQIANKNYSQRLHFESSDEFGELAEAFNSMAEQLTIFENSNLAKIMFEKKRIEAIINNMNDAIIGLSEKQIILFANIKAVQLLGLNEMELTGKYAPDVAITNDLMRLLINKQIISKPIKIVVDGKESYFNKENIAIVSEEKSIGEFVLLKNITHFQELDLAKTNFIATISHELKTPIASIKLSSKLLDDTRIGELNTEQKQLVQHITDDAERLLKIASEVLNMAQVETGRIQLNFQKVLVKNIVEYAVKALQFQADQKNIVLNVDGLVNDQYVYADLEKTVWVIVNLLSNAIRYSLENATVDIRITELNNQVQFTVIDHGKGIEQQYQDKIFDRFFQIPGNPKHGTGLGLAIAKEFITAQNGTIGLDCKAGQGATFYFKLPKG